VAAIATGDLFLAASTGFVQFNLSGVRTSGEYRVWLWQVDPDGGQKDAWVLERDELQYLKGCCTDGRSYYGNLEEINFATSSTHSHRTLRLRIAPDGTMDFQTIITGQVTTNIYSGSSDTNTLARNRAGHFWNVHFDGPTNPRIREYDAELVATGLSYPAPFPFVFGGPFRTDTELFWITRNTNVSPLTSTLVSKDMGTGAESLLYAAPNTGEPERYVSGADRLGVTPDWVAGRVDFDSLSSHSVHQVVNGAATLLHTYDPAVHEVDIAGGIATSPSGETVYFVAHRNLGSGSNLSSEFSIWAAPLGGTASQLWSSGVFANLGQMIPTNSLLCIKGGGGPRMFTTMFA
jgi:hypothetical protein